MIKLKYLPAFAVALLMALTPMLSVSALTTSAASLPFDFAGPVLPIAVSPPDQERPAIAYDNINNRYLVVWAQPGPGGLTDIWGRLFTPAGAPSPCSPAPFNISMTAGSSEFRPAVAFKGTSSATAKFLVVWETQIGSGPGAEWNVNGRLVGSSTSCMALAPAAPIAIATTPGVDERCPDVAANPSATSSSNRYLVVYTSSSMGWSAFGKFVTAGGSTACSPAFFIAATGSPHDLSCPAVAYGEPGAADFFTVVYRAGAGALVRKTVTAPGCGLVPVPSPPLLIDPFVPLGPGLSNDVRPDVAYNRACDQWLAGWADVTGGGVVIFGQRLNAAASALIGGPLTVLPAADPFGIGLVKTISIAGATNSGNFLVAFDGQTAAASFNAYARTVRCDGALGATDVEGMPAGVNDWFPAVAFSPLSGDFFIVWQHDPAPAAHDILGQKYAP
jgi:hypothetical protein